MTADILMHIKENNFRIDISLKGSTYLEKSCNMTRNTLKNTNNRPEFVF